MPPIPVFSDAPIVAAKAGGTSPQTSEAPTPTRGNDTTTTQDNASTLPYAPARPGAPAMPAPTGYVPKPPPAATRTLPHAQQDEGPPRPQPGAVPTPFASTPFTASGKTPAAPQPSGAAPPPASTTRASALGPAPTGAPTMPPQFSIPAPSIPHAATHSTTTSTAPIASKPGPTTLPLGDVPSLPATTSQYSSYPAVAPYPSTDLIYASNAPSALQPPPAPGGYVQDPYAGDMPAAQRASLEASERAERRTGLAGSLGLSGTGMFGGAAGSGGGGLGLDGSGSGAVGLGGEQGVWGTVKSWASAAGEKAVSLEEEVWRRVGSK